MFLLHTLTVDGLVNQFFPGLLLAVFLVMVIVTIWLAGNYGPPASMRAAFIGMAVSFVGIMIYLISQEQTLMKWLRVLFGDFDVAWMFLVSMMVILLGGVISACALLYRVVHESLLKAKEARSKKVAS